MIVNNKPIKKWYVIYCKSRHEKKIYDNLIEQRIDAFLPLQKTLKQWSDRKKWVEEPIFRSYLFVNIVYKKEYLNVLKTYGVVYFVKIENQASVIPEQQINDIKLILKLNIDFDISCEKLKKGSKVKLKHGPFAGMNGNIVKYHGKKRVQIEIDAIGQSLLVEVPTTYLDAI